MASLACWIATGSSILQDAAAQDAVPSSLGPAAQGSALQVYPLDVTLNKEGNAFVADRSLHGVWQWKDEKLSILFEGSPKFRTPLNAAYSIATDVDGTLLVGDSATREVYRIGDDAVPKPITGGKIGIPIDIAVKSDGTIYVADLELRRLVRIPAGTGDVEAVASVNPRGVFVDHQDRVWVVSQNPQQLLMVSDAGEVTAIVKERTFEFPHQVVVNRAGEAFVTDGYKKAIWRVKPGAAAEVFSSGAPLDGPVGIALDANDQLVVVDPRAQAVFRINADGKAEEWFKIQKSK